MKTLKNSVVETIFTFIVVHTVCLLSTRITGGGDGIIVNICELLASMFIYWTIKDDLK